jgi:hypothetical protein
MALVASPPEDSGCQRSRSWRTLGPMSSRLLTLETSEFSPRDRVTRWSEALTEVCGPLHTDTHGARTLDGSMRFGTVGRIRVGFIAASRHRVGLTPTLARGAASGRQGRRADPRNLRVRTGRGSAFRWVLVTARGCVIHDGCNSPLFSAGQHPMLARTSQAVGVRPSWRQEASCPSPFPFIH